MASNQLAPEPCPLCGGDGWRMIGNERGRHHYEPCSCEMGRVREAEHAADHTGHQEPRINPVCLACGGHGTVPVKMGMGDRYWWTDARCAVCAGAGILDPEAANGQ